MALSSPGDVRRQQPVEYVDFGSPRRPGRPRLSWLLLACLLIAATAIAVRHSDRPRRPVQVPVAVTDFGHPLLGIRQGWELFGLNSDSVVAIQLARGRVVRTALPPPVGSGPVSFIVGPSSAIVRPLDNAPGYLVPDSRPAQPLTGILARGSLLLPGPRPGQEWDTGGGSSSLVLVGADGHATSTRVSMPNKRESVAQWRQIQIARDARVPGSCCGHPGWSSQSAMSDGRGEILVASDSGSQYDASPHWLRPVAALLSAVGPTRWIGMTCSSGHCQNVVINPVTRSHRKLPGPPLHQLTWPWPAFPGVVAPDGLTAAIVADHGNGQVALEQMSLVSGAVKPIPVPINQNASSQTMVWSPDSQWLFVLDASGELLAVDIRTGKVKSLGIPLPDFSQLTVRA
jgi:hypothetical protein